MRKLFTKTVKKAILLSGTALMMASGAVNAATYTAIASGNFSSSASWTGGLIPPLTLSASDLIVIPSTFNINLDQNLMLNDATSSLTVNGTLTSTTSNYIVMTAGSLNGSGSIDIDSFSSNTTSGFNFTGSLTANKFHSANTNVATAAAITVDETLYLAAGTMTMASGSLTMSNNSTIVVKDGMLTVTGGTANLLSNYNVRYEMGTSSTVNSGVELTGNGLTDVEIMVGSANSVFLSNDLMVNGTLTLTSGNLTLNNKNISFASSSDLSASGTGKIVSSSGSDITVNAKLTGGLKLATSSNTVNDFTIDLSNSSDELMVDAGLNVTGTLTLQSGRLNVGSQSVTLQSGSGATISGGGANSYVITTMGGSLDVDVAASGSQMFYIGTMNNYAPVKITNNSSANNSIKAGVDAMVLANGTSGSSVSATQSAVNATWFIENSVSTGADVNIDVMWDASMEVNGFDRTNAYVSHYMNGSWDTDVKSAATASGSLYSLTRANVSSFSPFAVYDNKTNLAVNNVAANNSVSIYPNPASSQINVTFDAATTEPVQVAIYNMNGQVVKTTQLNNNQNTIDVSTLSNGMYYIQLNNKDINATQKFTKQ